MRDDYSLFRPQDYLQEYYATFDVEDAFVLSFLHRSYQRIGHVASVAEIGGGPCILTLISARKYAELIVVADYARENRLELMKWLAGDPSAYSWGPYFNVVAELEGGSYDIAAMEDEVRRKTNVVMACDIRQPNPLHPFPAASFDVVSCHSCVESVTTDREDFEGALRNIVGVCKPGGYLLMSFIKDALGYQVGNTRYQSVSVDEAYLREAMQGAGCEVLMLESVDGRPGQLYSGIIGLVARRIAG